ncbi:Translin [Testicularia cyperi]|uniref:Translin n=1 Tax=Testicularia cyperi TaxID=1882483 RepID=A0A317XQU2_9BASI|nr:Translin [Testicularia cyperi]
MLGHEAIATSSGPVVDLEPLFKELESERALADSIREKSKDLDRCFRALSSLLNGIHSTPGSRIDSLIDQTVPLFHRTRAVVAELAELIPEHQYYRWNDDFSFSIKNLCASVALTVLISTGTLVTKDQTAQVLGLAGKPSLETRLKLSTEEYLHGVINFLNELSRLAVNSVTLGDFRTPVRLATFVKDVHAGFQLLNLKNDSLRKRFDGIKYDVKKIEEIVYDISLRGLIKGEDDGSNGVAFPKGSQARQALVLRLAGQASA